VVILTSIIIRSVKKSLLILLFVFGNFFYAISQDLAANHYVTAREYYKSQDITNAKLELDSALRINPKYAEAHWLLAKIAEQEDDLSLAMKQLSETIANDPTLDEVYAERAELHYRMQDHQNYIISDMENAIYLKPDNIEYLRLKGFYYGHTLASGEMDPSYNKAISTLTEAIAMAPDNAQLYFDRGNYKFKNDQILTAMADLNKAVALAPMNAEFIAKRGLVRFMIEDFDASLTDYTQAIRLEPKNAYFYTNRGKTKHNMGNYNSAYNDYTYAIELLIYSIRSRNENIRFDDPLNKQLADVLMLRGVALAQENKPYDACIDFDRAYQLGAQKARNYIRRYCSN
jgi:tetratricopeptide (TPR) repeat protein